ncbi:MAG: hypothetical protein ACN6OR_04090, partial [Stenotrophomonas sp.]
MSISLDKLKALRKQAGLATAAPVEPAAPMAFVGAASAAKPAMGDPAALPVAPDASVSSPASDTAVASRLTPLPQ